jgi:16S rRNA (cytosine1402-N4)-methyltransferase
MTSGKEERRVYVHEPVLLEQTLSLLLPERQGPVLVDATLGEGGHAAAFLAADPRLVLVGIEKDQEILDKARERLKHFEERAHLFRSGFREFFERYDELVARRPGRIFFDLGVSMFHFQVAGRGFSFSRDEPLDMRLDKAQEVNAADMVNTASEAQLRELIRRGGGERLAAMIAKAIVRERTRTPIHSSRSLAEIIWKAVPPSYRYRRLHPATRTFQALRITVNNELEELEAALPRAFELLTVGGRMGIISFHSLEDRIVKRFFQECNKSCTCPPESPICQCGGRRRAVILTRKPVLPAPTEVARNPASRSARLRVVEKIA